MLKVIYTFSVMKTMSLEIENDLIRMNNQLCDFSADGRFLAIAYQTNLIIKSSKTFTTIHSFIFTDIIEVSVSF